MSLLDLKATLMAAMVNESGTLSHSNAMSKLSYTATLLDNRDVNRMLLLK